MSPRGTTWLLLTLWALWLSVPGSLAYLGNGVVLPNDPYIYIGNNLTLYCNLTKFDTTYDSRNLFFTHKSDEVIPARFVTITSTRSAVLRFPVLAPDDNAMYICKLNRSGNHPEIIGNQFVMVEYEPKPVTEIDCRVYNWENMTCSWDLGVDFLHPNTMDIELIWTNSDYQYQCKHQTSTSCKWLANGSDAFVSDIDYRMTVIIVNKATKPEPTSYPERSHIFVIKTSELVEPAPVSNLTAEKNSSCITLSWSHRKTRRDKIYRVYFRSDKDRTWRTKNVGDANHITLCGLQPHMHYEFNISCKPRLYNRQVRGFWSQGTVITVLTDEDVPSVAPEMGAGSYVESPCQHLCKQLMLYWKPLDPEHANGNITYYRIDYRNIDTGSDWDTTSVTETQRLLMLVATDSYIIQLRAATKRGVSNVYTEIYVPAQSKKPGVVEHVVTAHNLSQETSITVSWSRPRALMSSSWHNLTSYTVYWCRGYKIERRCQEPIQSQEVSLSQQNVTLRVSMFETHMFGVAVNALTMAGQHISSGFKWNMCTYVRDTKPEVAPINVRLSVYQPDDGLTLEWDRLTCGDTVAYIQEYVIYMCPTSGRGDNCSGDTSQFQVSNKANTYTVEHLVEGSKVRVWMTALSQSGPGPDSDILYGVVLNRSLKTEEIGGIAVASLFVLIVFLSGIILCFRRVIRTVKQKYFVPVPIEIPHTLPPLPPIPMPPRQLTPESDSSDGIYEKIDGPPSPSSSTESTTGVEAPLIHHKWKLSNLKNQIYTKKKEHTRHSNDSGRSSMSHSADTLLMRLHPSHFKRNRKPKKSNKSESDSGVIVDGRGQVSSFYSSHPDNDGEETDYSQTVYDFGRNDSKSCKLPASDVNPYSCVDIVDKINSERLNRKVNENCLDLEEDEGVQSNKYNKGSTLSLPPAFCSKVSAPVSQPLCLKAKSTGNELDMEENKLCSMMEAKEFESSDIYSEDGTLDSTGDHEHETSESLNSQEPVGNSQNSSGSWVPAINSYSKFCNGETMELSDEVFARDPPGGGQLLAACDCGCHRAAPAGISDGYVVATHTPENCGCETVTVKGGQTGGGQGQGHQGEESKYGEVWQDTLPAVAMATKPRPTSFVHNLPPHFFASLTTVDPSTTTEL